VESGHRRLHPGARRPHAADDPGTLGNGCGLFDYDNDGWLDVPFARAEKVALNRNNGKGGSRTKPPGAACDKPAHVWQGVATGDYDNDGKTDLFLSGYRDGALYHTRRRRRFREVTPSGRGREQAVGRERVLRRCRP
jgi:hypothetical protein